MGIYRYLLALLVIASHFFQGDWLINPGPFAVYGFMIISGFVMTKLITRYYPEIVSVGGFYWDRALRILPQFIAYIALTYIFVLYVGDTFEPSAGVSTKGCTLGSAATNVLILFNFVAGAPVSDCLLLPQSWSLGLETAFYLIIPFLLTNVGRPTFWLVFMASAVVFVKSMLGQINFNEWSYFNLPGTLFIFQMGSALATLTKSTPVRFSRVWAFICLIGGVAIVSILIVVPGLGYSREALLAIAMVPPLIYFGSRHNFGRLDSRLGDISYGVFLNHVLLTYCMDWQVALTGFSLQRDLFGFILLVLTSSLVSYLTYSWIERPFITLRRRWRVAKHHPSAN